MIAVTIEEKEVLIRKSAFPEPPVDNSLCPVIQVGNSHKLVTLELVQKALFAPSVKKSPGLDMLNF